MDGNVAHALALAIEINAAHSHIQGTSTGAYSDRVAPDNHFKTSPRPTSGSARYRSGMTITSAAAGQPHPNARQRAGHRNNKSAGFRPHNTKPPRNPKQDYERYLALAHAEARSGDRIAAENYFQHAEHYLRSMRGNPN
jgi:hypothetical protein